MNVAEEAFKELFPERVLPRIEIKYSGRFKDYNSNVTYRGDNFSFGLSREWEDVDASIVKGLIQHLFLKIHRKKLATMNIDLYNSFMKNLHRGIKKDKSDPLLEASFNRMNDMFFSGTLEKTNLEWGSHSKAMLANYNFHTDTIRMSKYFINAPAEILDYIMYHEMLHKKLKFKNSGGFTSHHTPEFRMLEKQYPGFKSMDNKIKAHLRSKRKPVSSIKSRPQIKAEKNTLLHWIRRLY